MTNLSGTLEQFVESIKPRIGNLAEEIANELQEDEPELESLQVEEKHGDSLKQAINNMEDAVIEKHQALSNAEHHISTVNDMIERPKSYGKVSTNKDSSGFSEEKFVNKFEEKIAKAKENLKKAEQEQGNIEGLREQAEHSLRQQLKNLEEFGEAENQARSITADAEEHLEEVEEMEDKLEEARQEFQ